MNNKQEKPIIGRDGRRYPARHGNQDERNAKIRQLRAEGMSLRAIAGEIGCSHVTVRNVLNK